MTPPLKIPNRLGWTAYAIAAVVAMLDQASKAWILGPFDLPAKGQVVVSPLFKLSMVWNPGVSYGLLQSHGALGRWLLVGFATCVVIGLAVWIAQASRPLTAVAIGLIMGGAIGNNLIDRVRLGMVADFLDFSGIGFKWVFNIADSAITVGVILLLAEMLLPQRPPAAAERP
ncbi:MAG: signal peptidase II [Caulobacteraceae bacterium]|nr:signal peptidase II [Caulobacteraceae bacterium]